MLNPRLTWEEKRAATTLLDGMHVQRIDLARVIEEARRQVRLEVRSAQENPEIYSEEERAYWQAQGRTEKRLAELEAIRA